MAHLPLRRTTGGRRALSERCLAHSIPATASDSAPGGGLCLAEASIEPVLQTNWRHVWGATQPHTHVHPYREGSVRGPEARSETSVHIRAITCIYTFRDTTLT